MVIDRIIKSVIREQLIVEGTNQKKLRARAVKALMDRGVDEQEAIDWEKWFFETHFHGAHDRVVRLEAFFAGAWVNASSDNVNRLVEILEFIKRNWQKDGFYDIGKLKAENPSNYEYETLNNLFGSMVDEEKRHDDDLANSKGGSEMNPNYSVVNVKTYKEAHKIGEYSCPSSKLCFTTDKQTWDNYLAKGANECYVILRNGYEKMKAKDYVDDKKRPYDDYGLSMIFLFIKPNGEIASSNTRWNHKTGSNYQGDVDQSFKKSDIAELLGVNFNDVFKPNDVMEKKMEIVMQRLANGEHPRNVFDTYRVFDGGFARVQLFNKWNYVNPNGELLSPKLWFDFCNDKFFEGYNMVRLDGKSNLIGMNGELISKQWFDDCDNFFDGFVKVKLDDKGWNYIDHNGEYLSNHWFDMCFNRNKGFFEVSQDEKFNFLKLDGELASPDQWFDKVYILSVDLAKVRVGTKYNIYKPNGEILSPNQWFDNCGDFYEGISIVELDGKWNFIDVDGNILSPKQWFDDISYFDQGFGVVELNGKCNYINRNGDILLDEWVDNCNPFVEGFGEIKLNGKYNYTNKRGEIISPNLWFDEVEPFYDGFSRVRQGDMYNIISDDGELVSPDIWFEEVYYIDNYMVMKAMDGKVLYLDYNGNLYDEKPQLSESRIISESIRRTLRKLI